MATRTKLPTCRYNAKGWIGWGGGDSRTLYAFTDIRTGKVHVYPGGYRNTQIGPAAIVRIATREEARKHWQDPLHSGWKTAG